MESKHKSIEVPLGADFNDLRQAEGLGAVLDRVSAAPKGRKKRASNLREYGTVKSAFWIGGTGAYLRGDTSTQVLALYLMTSPHANMIGLYYLPLPLIIHETGLGEDDVRQGLKLLTEQNFCKYDEGRSMVWVVNFARHQLNLPLVGGDKQIAGIRRVIADLPSNEFVESFLGRYGNEVGLPQSIG